LADAWQPLTLMIYCEREAEKAKRATKQEELRQAAAAVCALKLCEAEQLRAQRRQTVAALHGRVTEAER
jgi:hypothetical protein